MEEQGGGVVYDGGTEGEVGAEGSPVICSAELPLVTQQVLTVSTPEDEEPKVCCYGVCGTAYTVPVAVAVHVCVCVCAHVHINERSGGIDR